MWMCDDDIREDFECDLLQRVMPFGEAVEEKVQVVRSKVLRSSVCRGVKVLHFPLTLLRRAASPKQMTPRSLIIDW